MNTKIKMKAENITNTNEKTFFRLTREIEIHPTEKGWIFNAEEEKMLRAGQYYISPIEAEILEGEILHVFPEACKIERQEYALLTQPGTMPSLHIVTKTASTLCIALSPIKIGTVNQLENYVFQLANPTLGKRCVFCGARVKRVVIEDREWDGCVTVHENFECTKCGRYQYTIMPRVHTRHK